LLLLYQETETSFSATEITAIGTSTFTYNGALVTSTRDEDIIVRLTEIGDPNRYHDFEVTLKFEMPGAATTNSQPYFDTLFY